MSHIYLDYNASTPIAPEVTDAMRPFLETAYGNPSSPHWAGMPAREAVDSARRAIAALLHCSADGIVFTSGGSESNNAALKGAYFSRGVPNSHFITSTVEHPSIIEPCRFLERLGAEITYLDVDGTGLVDPDDVKRAITGRTVMVSVMHANNEVGTIQPIAEIASVARDHGVLFHTDAAQSAGKIEIDVDALDVDLLTIAGHKLYGPKGVGALYIRPGVKIEPLIHGASHESGRRAGTESALMAAGLGKACEIARSMITDDGIRQLRDSFWDKLRTTFGDGAVLNGHPQKRLPNTLNVSFPGHIGGDILSKLDGVAASTGSACHSGQIEMSPVLTAMGVPAEIGAGAIRFSLGRSTTRAEIEKVVKLVSKALGRG